MRVLAVIILLVITNFPAFAQWRLPIAVKDRKNISLIKLTPIGQFALPRKARPTIAAHLHTGIDIQRPGKDYDHENIFPIADGIVVSKRTDGAYAQLIIEHENDGSKIWSVYEHIAGIVVSPGDVVRANDPIARFMNRKELDRYGWQFDHFHFEILKVKPRKINEPSRPDRHYQSYSLECRNREELMKYFYDPFEFMKSGKH